MVRLNQPLTRENYLAFCYGKEVPDRIPAEEQHELPPPFRQEYGEPVEEKAPQPVAEAPKKPSRIKVIRDEDGAITGFESH